MISVNWWAILVSSLAALLIGAFWYGPLFGQKWMHALGWDPNDKAKMEGMKRSVGAIYFWHFIGGLVMATVVAVFISRLGVMTWLGGVKLGFLAWLGFVLPIKFSDSLWGGKQALFWISCGNMLVTMLVMGAILGAWR